MGSCCPGGTVTTELKEHTPFITQVTHFLDTEPDFERTQVVEGAPDRKEWYHGAITDEEANFRVNRAGGGNGCYLVYDNPRKRGGYVLVTLHKCKLYRWKINKRKSDKKFIVGDDGPAVIGHDTIRELIHYHRSIRGKPLKLQDGGHVVLSKEYVCRV